MTAELHQGDCLEWMKGQPDAIADLAILDPPYNIQSTRGGGAFGSNAREYHAELAPLSRGLDKNIIKEVLRLLKAPNLYIWGNWRAITEYIPLFKGYNTNLLSWHKSNPVPMCSNKYLNDTEYCLFIRAPGVKLRGGYEDHGTWWLTPLNTEDRKLYGHPTPKPLEIIRQMVRNSTDPGDTVLDPFTGSGTTGHACVLEHRHFIGCEIDAGYFETARARIKGASQAREGTLDTFMEDA